MSHAPAPGPTPEIKYFFIRRPIFSAVISIVIVLLGLFAIRTLPVNRYPNITPPSVQVTATYPGATAEDVAQAVAAPIEQQLSGLNGLLYYKSSNSSDGVMSLSVYFDISRDQDLAAVDVQNQVQVALPQLPQAVRDLGITVKKAQTDILLVAGLVSTDPRYDVEYLTNYANINLLDEIKRLPGMGDAQVFSQRQFSMLISLDADRLTSFGLTVSDVASAVREQNVTNPAGRIGREPAPTGTEFTIPVTGGGRLKTVAEFENIIVRARADGSVVRVRDIATVKLGSQNYDAAGRLDGKVTALIGTYLRPGANALEVRKAFLARMTELGRTLPAGITWTVPFDTTPFITESIKEVLQTLVEAMILVTLVVFVFLQNWRATLIPILAVPVSVIGTFFGLQALGFTINLLTLLALVLAIGIVVDDAIVVIENVERLMADEGLTPPQAADKAMTQVAGALIAIVLVLCAVFLPVAFLGGITGAMYQQFAITIVIAVVLSGIVALTLTPALCALLLRPEHGTSRGRFFDAFNRVFDRTRGGYLNGVGKVLDRGRVFVACFLVIMVLIVVLVRRVPSGFVPSEDKGYFLLAVQLPDAASKQRTDAFVSKVEQFLLKQEEVSRVVAIVGTNFIQSANQTNSATMFILMKPWEERSGSKHSIDAVLGRVNGFLFGQKEAIAFAINLPEIPGLGTTAGLEANLQDRGIGDINQFAALVNSFIADANKLPDVTGVNTFLRVNVPQLYVNVDREKAKALGVSLTDLYGTLQAMLSTLYINDFNLYGKTYRVQAEAQERFREKPEDIGKLYVRAQDQTMVPVSALASTEFRAGPTLVTRFNGFTSAQITGAPPPGGSSGRMLDAIDNLSLQKYQAQGLGVAYSGQSFQERSSAGQAGVVFALGIILVFLVLAAQYESWTIPFAVMFGIPFGVFGALLGVFLRGMPNDVYFQVGLITVVGLAAKNAILIVEFANELRAQGRSIRDAAIEAGRERLRPILMTSFAFILGSLPLILASGAGAAARHSLGTGVIFGMLIATTVGIFFIPLFFVLIRAASERGFGRKRDAVPATEPAAEGT